MERNIANSISSRNGLFHEVAYEFGQKILFTDHNEIRRWAASHNGRPARVKGTGKGKDPGVLRLDFDEREKSRGNFVELVVRCLRKKTSSRC